MIFYAPRQDSETYASDPVKDPDGNSAGLFLPTHKSLAISRSTAPEWRVRGASRTISWTVGVDQESGS
jgi:hypothetical protein